MIYTNIKDARGRKLQLDADNTVPIVIHGHPPLENERVLELPFSQFFTTNGSATGSNNMVVAGTLASPIDFYVIYQNKEYKSLAYSHTTPFVKKYFSPSQFILDKKQNLLEKYTIDPTNTNKETKKCHRCLNMCIQCNNV